MVLLPTFSIRLGNRLSASSSLTGVSSGTYSYGADDLASTESYDANGNVTATGGRSFTYESENHLVTMNGGAASMVYDGDGNWVAKAVNGATTSYLVDDLNPTGYPQVMEETANGAVRREYAYGLQRISEAQTINNVWTPSFFGYDGSDTFRQLTNAAGAVSDTYVYDAFGDKIDSTGTTPNNYFYRGEQYDSDLNFYYLRARYYNPATGRFMSRDPLDGHISIPVTLHKYLYASGNPVNRIDRSGKADEGEEAGLDLRSLTKSVDYAAGQLNIERKLFGSIIHTIKAAAGVGGATDPYFSIPSGNVYLLKDEEYEIIDNVFGNL
jgi:RHS repeat-associated protein